VSAASDRRRIRALGRWWQDHARDLPWRRRRSGYTALVAEAMLQQTQVSRVIEAYRNFLRRFPSVGDLAAADEQAVLAQWQGLGYYRRARHLHRAAQAIVSEFGGRVPRDAAQLRRLPGVGRYTAGAIASLVYDQPEPIVDGNVQRVLARWHGDESPPDDPATVRRTWDRAGALVRLAPRPSVLNEALMELGATVCTPRSPRCSSCPVSRDCQAHREGRAQEIPPPRRRAARHVVHHHAVVMMRGGRILLEQRSEAGIWQGLWQPPAVEAEGPLGAGEVAQRLRDRGFALRGLEHCGTFDHQLTHRRVRFHVFRGSGARCRGRWEAPGGIAEVPMSNAHRRVLALVAG
jgi:A/G-specific adenine glycosylase